MVIEEVMDGWVGTKNRETEVCSRCHEPKDRDDVITCAECGVPACCDCQSEAENALSVCGGRCASTRVYGLMRELDSFRAQASTAAAIVRQGAASYVRQQGVA